jgi:hypothetical protein
MHDYCSSAPLPATEAHLIHVFGQSRITLNEILDKNPKQAVESARNPVPAHDEGWFRLNASSFLDSLSDFTLTPRAAIDLPVPIKAPIAPLSAWLATLIFQIYPRLWAYPTSLA